MKSGNPKFLEPSGSLQAYNGTALPFFFTIMFMYSYHMFMYFYCYEGVVFCLCCFVYCLCVNVYFQLPPALNPIAVNKIYQYQYQCVLL